MSAKGSSKSSTTSSKAGVAASSGESKAQHTLVSLYDIDDLAAHHCGYCNQNGNISVGMSSDTMLIQDYQNLIDRGWRRSGTYIYKPVMDKTCCPLYTIKCGATEVVLSKSQRVTLKNMKRFLEMNVRKRQSNPEQEDKKSKATGGEKSPKSESSSSAKAAVAVDKNKATKPKPIIDEKFRAQKIFDLFLSNSQADLSKTPNELLNVKRLKAKHRRLFKKLKGLKDKSLLNEYTDIEKHLKRKPRFPSADQPSIESLLKTDSNSVNKLETVLLRSWPPSKQFQESLKEEHDVYVKYQTTIHKDSPLECNMSQFERFLCTSPLLFTSYQGALFNANAERIQQAGIDESITGDIKSLGYGSFHQQYKLNGKIIAVGVIDILDSCVSSVYFFYDPAYDFLNLGTYSALREIAFVRQLNKLDPMLKYYYLGFYAHSCKKMQYKGRFHPSYLLCPEVYTWHPIEYCIRLLEVNKYSRFAPSIVATSKSLSTAVASTSADSSSISTDPNENDSIDDVRIRVKFRDSETKVFKFNEFCQFLNPNFIPQFTHLIEGYCKLFGKKFTRTVLIKF